MKALKVIFKILLVIVLIASIAFNVAQVMDEETLIWGGEGHDVCNNQTQEQDQTGSGFPDREYAHPDSAVLYHAVSGAEHGSLFL